MAFLFDHWMWAVLLWTLLSFAFGVLFGQCMSDADNRAERERGSRDHHTDTNVIDFRNAPREWLS